MQKHRKKLLIGVPLVFILFIIFVYLFGGRYESTDDAYVQAAKAGINSNVPGQVTHIYVKDNQLVKKDDPLFELDTRPYKIAVDNAKATLLYSKLKVLILKATYRQALAGKLEAVENYAYATKEYRRQKKLAASGVSSDMDLNKAFNMYQIARQQVEVANQQVQAALADLNNNPEIAMNEHPVVQEAQAGLDKANLDLEYTLIKAPFDGVVTKVEMLQVGDVVAAGEPVFALISDSNVWVEANFKETQITHMRPGQYVKIEVDAYPDMDFRGRVVSMSPGTGAAFSLLPAENATGNWVKVVQRVPVRVSINAEQNKVLLASGLSASVTVDTEKSRL